MNPNRPLILISNDDGYQAKGINELIDTLRPVGDIVVMAPDGPRSGAACAMTSEHPVRYYKVREEKGVVVYRCTGTPVDCVKLALHILPRRPDLVVGGINHGDNSSVNVHYSGTMGVVLEGCMKGIPSIGFSLCDHAPDANFKPMLSAVENIVLSVLEHRLPEGVCLNVNAPVAESYKGVRICRQTQGAWENEWKRCPHPRGGEYYWLTGNYVTKEPVVEETDHWALDNGYIAITPIQIDMTAYGVMEELKSWNL
ncbi:MAG: 5'/3'-nucleotidase SurE [Bacteroides sp.]|nr:5'/3'-nucleotidase SurE [Bacteroides sp.]